MKFTKILLVGLLSVSSLSFGAEYYDPFPERGPQSTAFERNMWIQNRSIFCDTLAICKPIRLSLFEGCSLLLSIFNSFEHGNFEKTKAAFILSGLSILLNNVAYKTNLASLDPESIGRAPININLIPYVVGKVLAIAGCWYNLSIMKRGN